MRTGWTVFLILLLVAATAGVLYTIYSTEPQAEKTTATKETAMLVDVVPAERGAFRPVIHAVGAVRPIREVMVSPRVGGQIVDRSSAFEPGGLIPAGDGLVTLDPADFEIVLAQRLAELHQAEAELSVEMGRQKVAERDYALLDEELPPEQRALVLRAPQLATANANVEAAQAFIRQAELDLARAQVPAPFDALVMERDVDVGSQVARGETLGRVVGVDAWWVIATVPRGQLRWLQVPGPDGGPASRVTVRDRAAWGPGVSREGVVDRVLGELDAGTRLARVLVRVDDPLGRAATAEDPRPPLMLGAFVDADIEGIEVADVVRLDRAHLRKDDTVWVMEDGVLRIRPVEVLFTDEDYAYLASGLEEGDPVVVTDLSTVVDGSALRLAAAAPQEEGASD